VSITISALAGKPAPRSLWTDVPKLLAAYIDLRPDPTVPAQRVAFGTEDVYKIYAESFRGEDHLRGVLREAQGIVDTALAAAAR
jgi:phosphoglucomutase